MSVYRIADRHQACLNSHWCSPPRYLDYYFDIKLGTGEGLVYKQGRILTDYRSRCVETLLYCQYFLNETKGLRSNHTKENGGERNLTKTNKVRRESSSIDVRCKMLCSESLPLWNLVNQLICSPGKLQKIKKTSHHTCFHFLTVSSFLSKFLNTHSGNTLNKAFPGSVEVIRDRYMLEVQKIEQEQCTVQNYYTTRIPKYEHCPVEESRRIMASSLT